MTLKFGAHIYLWTQRWSDGQIDLLDRAALLGLSCLEIAVGDDVEFSPRLVRERARRLGMELILSPGAQWPMECDISADDPQQRQFGLAWHRRQIDLAHECGAIAYTGAIYGHPGCVQRRRPPLQEFARTAANLHLLAEHARSAGLQLILEPMSHFRTHLVNTPAQALRLIAQADHPSLGVLLDTYHLATEIRDFGAAVRDCGDRLWGLHACENDRGVPGGGLIPWNDLFAALGQRSGEAYVLLEAYNSSLGDFAHSRGMFHDVCPDGDAFVRQGIAFLRKTAGAAGL